MLANKKKDYNHNVIIPQFNEGGENAQEIINCIPKDKLVLLDKKINGITGKFAAAYENFEDNIYNALNEAIDQLAKYHTLKIIFPEHSYYPPEILRGFKNFARIMLFGIKWYLI